MDTSVTIREFTLQFLEQITDNFSKEHVIGSGGYGVVYKGVLDNGEEIALKKLHQTPGLDDIQFKNEFNNLMRAQHVNITRLVGYCYNLRPQRVKYNGEYIFAQVEERDLCFEYLQGGSLDRHISDASSGLDWHTRFNIIKGVCEGLNYLHNGMKDPIYHLDLKPANILLDENMVPKIGDFGLSRLFPSAHTCITKKATGTPYIPRSGYMPPEYIERQEITPKYDVFSLGVTVVRIIAGDGGYPKCAQMSSQGFLEHVHENWERRQQETMSSHTSEQVKTCIKIALRCVEVDRVKRPTIAEIVDELNKVDIAQSSTTGQVAKNQNSNSERRGGIVFRTSDSDKMQLDIFSCPFSPSSVEDELYLTDGISCNYNGRPIPGAALKTIVKSYNLPDEGSINDADVDAGHVSGTAFVSERDDGLETLYIALHFNTDFEVAIFSLADIFGVADFSGARLEDSGCFGGGYSVGTRSVEHCLIYASTKESVQEFHGPSTMVYKTSLVTGKTECLTPQGVIDLSPAVSPSGKTVAVASFQRKSWNGVVHNLKTDIYVMNVDNEEGLGRKLLIKDGGWPSWGSDNIIFFHRRTGKTSWGVYLYNIITEETVQVTPHNLDAVTPAAISETKVAVATRRHKHNPYSFGHIPVEALYQHIEIFDTTTPGLQPLQITQKLSPECHHYSPFVLDGGARIGYHRFSSSDGLHKRPNLHKLKSPVKDVGLYQLSSGIFPSFSKDGSKLAFVDRSNEVWVVDSQALRMVYHHRGPNNIYGPEWNHNPDKDILYVMIGPSYDGVGSWPASEIYSIHNVSGPVQSVTVQRLTYGGFCNGFPSSSPDGNKFVFTSTRPSESDMSQSKSDSLMEKGYSQSTREDLRMKQNFNLYIILSTEVVGESESEEGWVTRLTNGPWIDTMCQWSPNEDWVVFCSTRGKTSESTAEMDSVLGLLYSVHLVKAGDPTVVIRVMNSDGHSSPVFSPDGRSIAMMSDLGGVSVDPFSMPRFMSVGSRYNNIFMVDIDPDDLKKKKNKDVIKGFERITHSKYQGWALAWTSGGLGMDTYEWWNNLMAERHQLYSFQPQPKGPHVYEDVNLTNKMWVMCDRRNTI